MRDFHQHAREMTRSLGIGFTRSETPAHSLPNLLPDELFSMAVANTSPPPQQQRSLAGSHSACGPDGDPPTMASRSVLGLPGSGVRVIGLGTEHSRPILGLRPLSANIADTRLLQESDSSCEVYALSAFETIFRLRIINRRHFCIRHDGIASAVKKLDLGAWHLWRKFHV